MSAKYDHKLIEKKWQEKWESGKLYIADTKTSKKPFFNLWMFPYPSAEGLHAGHAFASTGSDIYGRFARMNDHEVFQPIGYDSFGIHSENYAIKINENPNTVVKRTTKHYEEQMRSLGHGYDWTRTVTTSDPDYYRWTQWLFVQMFKAGLVYKKKATVNFCPSCKTVLADEQVMNPKTAGKEPRNSQGEVVEDTGELKVCERCGTIAEKKDLDQWFFKITKYADRLLSGLDKIDWSERVVSAQRNWIGKSEGMIINFKDEEGHDLPVFTTRPDTLNAVTFIVVADEEMYNQEDPEKIGKFTGKYAIDPLTGKKLPIWKTNYVAPGYGTGNVMGVPAWDERDREFAQKYHLDIVEKEPNKTLWQKLEKDGVGKKHTNYHLRDWLVSRQRYWGAPIPMIYCSNCEEKGRGYLIEEAGDASRGAPKPGLPLVGGFGAGERQDPQNYLGWWPDENLPVLLPNISDYKPEGTGKGPLANHKEFYEVKCPKCGSAAKRETDVMDTFVDSSWYFLRYPSVGNDKVAFDPKITKKWLPIDLYFGGAEHAVLHLLYMRFVTMALKDLGYLDFEEPAPKFFAHGLMIKDGAKMSKSRGNVVNPDEYIEKFGADALRLYLAFMGPMDASPDFRDSGMEGSRKFLDRVWRLFGNNLSSRRSSTFGAPTPNNASSASSRDLIQVKLHQTVKGVTEDIKQFKYNTAIAKLMELVNVFTQHKVSNTEHLKTLALLLAPFVPHLAEEIWVSVLGQPFSIHKASWPHYNAELVASEETTIVIQINGKVRGMLSLKSEIAGREDKVVEEAKNDSNAAKWLEGKTIKKTIFVPQKLVNFVV